jgi:hypothetical protein
MRSQRPVPVFRLVWHFDELHNIAIAVPIWAGLMRGECALDVLFGRLDVSRRRCSPDLAGSMAAVLTRAKIPPKTGTYLVARLRLVLLGSFRALLLFRGIEHLILFPEISTQGLLLISCCNT